MPRPRLPMNVHRLKGSDKKDPQRFKDRNEPECNGELGDPPDFLSDEQKQAWREIEANAPPGVLWKSDRAFVEVTSAILAKIRSGEGTAADYRNLAAALGKMGMTPADRSKIDIPKPPEKDNPFAEFARRK